ncbi:cytochrome c oxidase subunit 3 [Aeromicrobium alkaliterrae]
MSVFAAFFIAYLWDFGSDRAGFVAEASHLVVALGLANALVLLTSSFLVVRAVQTHRSGGDPRAALAGALVLSACFAVVKVVEYTLEIGDGHTLTSSTFFTYYYALTGLHLMHVAIGTLLLVTWRRSVRPGGRRVSTRFVEGAAGYWHMVDLLWILIFSFVYIGSHA